MKFPLVLTNTMATTTATVLLLLLMPSHAFVRTTMMTLLLEDNSSTTTTTTATTMSTMDRLEYNSNTTLLENNNVSYLDYNGTGYWDNYGNLTDWDYYRNNLTYGDYTGNNNETTRRLLMQWNDPKSSVNDRNEPSSFSRLRGRSDRGSSPSSHQDRTTRLLQKRPKEGSDGPPSKGGPALQGGPAPPKGGSKGTTMESTNYRRKQSMTCVIPLNSLTSCFQ